MKINKVVLGQELQTQQEAFHFLAHQMYLTGIIDDEASYVEALQDRENQGTTGLIDGFAIPHGKCSAVKEAGAIYVRNINGIEWNSLDESKITDIFALAIPQDGDEHLAALIDISTQLMDSKQCEKLRLTMDKDEIKAIFE